MRAKYSIELNGKYIGYTFFESHDASMGCVLGEIVFENIDSGYEFFSAYCRKNNIVVNDDVPEEQFITTQSIEGLKAFNREGIEIKGVGACIEGFEDKFQIDVFGISYPFYEEEFPHHVEDDKNRFKKE